MARSFFNSDREELELGKLAEYVISVRPDGSSLKVIESSSDIEFDAITSAAYQRPQIAASMLVRLM